MGAPFNIWSVPDRAHRGRLVRRSLARIFWLTVGLTAVALAILGVALPLLPTTPFLLVAAFAFARSSKRLSTWLHNHRVFGPLITNWQEHGAIPRRAKIMGLLALAATPLISILIGAPHWTIAVQIPIILASGIFIATRPSGPRDANHQKDSDL